MMADHVRHRSAVFRREELRGFTDEEILEDKKAVEDCVRMYNFWVARDGPERWKDTQIHRIYEAWLKKLEEEEWCT